MQNKRRLWIIILIALAVVGLGGYYLFRQLTPTAVADGAEQAVQTATVRRGDITISATGAGAVIPTTEVVLSFGTSGTLSALLVDVGDSVQVGDLLAQLDDTAAQQALANAKLAYEQAIMQVDGSATQAGVSYSDITLEQARLTLEQAQQDLDELRNWAPDPDDIAVAEANLSAAQAAYNAARGQEAASSDSAQVSQISLAQAQRDLQSAQEAWDTAYDPGREWEFGDPRRATALENERDAADAALLRAQDSLAIAELNYNASVSSTNISSSTNAQSNLLAAQLALEEAQSGPTEDEITAAETAVEQARLSYQQAQLNKEADALSLQQAELNLQAAQQDLAATQLYAPMDGTILSVEAHAGEQVSGTLLTMADLTQPLLEVYMDETDLDKVATDFEADVVFDALPEQTFSGTVTQVDPQLYDQNGLTVVRAVVQLDADSFAKPQTLPVGMNATVDIIGGRAVNALLVPVEAVREATPGEYVVFVMTDGEAEMRFVEVGLQDFTFAEILSGVQEGDVVTTGIVQTQ